VANGCLLVDDVSAPPAAAPGPGPCPRSEIALAEGPHPNPNAYLAHTLPVRVRCVAAPRACRGTLRLTTTNQREHEVVISRRLRFSILAGHAHRLHVPLTCAGYRRMRAELARESAAIVSLDARTDDGERFPGDPYYEVSSGPAEVMMRRCEGASAVEPTGLPPSVDVGPLRGTRLSGTPCTFRRGLEYGNPGAGTVRVWLDCARAQDVESFGFVEVERVQSGHDIPEDSLRCETERDRDGARLYPCDLWHGKVTLHARAFCIRRCTAVTEARAKEAARATMARLVERIATLPEQPCRLCPKYIPPQRVQQLTRTFTGNGPTQLGTIRVQVDSTINYGAARGMRMTSGRPPRVLMQANRHEGHAHIPRGTYHNVTVTATGSWTVTIQPR
jgi:hypothetical protein